MPTWPPGRRVEGLAWVGTLEQGRGLATGHIQIEQVRAPRAAAGERRADSDHDVGRIRLSGHLQRVGGPRQASDRTMAWRLQIEPHHLTAADGEDATADRLVL